MEAHIDARRNRLHCKGQILKTIYCLKQQYNTLDVYEIHRNKIYDKTAKMAGKGLIKCYSKSLPVTEVQTKTTRDHDTNPRMAKIQKADNINVEGAELFCIADGSVN